MDSEILHQFDERRQAFKPYGLTCELWTPRLMCKPDRHNEIEINYFLEGGLTYLIQGHKIKISAQRLCIFWGLIPHQIIHSDGNHPYFVCTIPFSMFLEWKLPTAFVDKILKGEILIENSEADSYYDEYLLKNWIKDLKDPNSSRVVLLEIQARLYRMALKSFPKNKLNRLSIHTSEISHVEKIAIYIAQNYSSPIKVSDIGDATDLHPDYANTLFKKAFGCTLSEYIMEERIAQAQRKLATTDHSITEIAFECGFNSISRFNAAFQKINACSPREFRKSFH